MPQEDTNQTKLFSVICPCHSLIRTHAWKLTFMYFFILTATCRKFVLPSLPSGLGTIHCVAPSTSHPIQSVSSHPHDEWCNPLVSVIMTVVCKRRMICNFPHPSFPFHSVNRARRSGYKVTGPMQQSGIPSRIFVEHFYSASTSSGFRLRIPSSLLCMKTFLEGIYRKHSSVVVLLLWPLSSYPNEIVWRRFVTSGTCEAFTMRGWGACAPHFGGYGVGWQTYLFSGSFVWGGKLPGLKFGDSLHCVWFFFCFRRMFYCRLPKIWGTAV